MGTVIIHPEPGYTKAIAQELLELAESPYHVEYVMWPSVGFRVPEYLYDLFVGAQAGGGLIPMSPESTERVGVQLVEFDMAETPETPVEPVKRKPGRPKKNVEGQ